MTVPENLFISTKCFTNVHYISSLFIVTLFKLPLSGSYSPVTLHEYYSCLTNIPCLFKYNSTFPTTNDLTYTC